MDPADADIAINNEAISEIAQVKGEVQSSTREEVHLNPPRTSTRVSHPPSWMIDYVTTMKGPKHPYSMTNYVSCRQLSTNYQAYLTKMSMKTELRSYEEAAKDAR